MMEAHWFFIIHNGGGDMTKSELIAKALHYKALIENPKLYKDKAFNKEMFIAIVDKLEAIK